MPKFADIRAWEQAELLMQPVFIRVIDNLRKQLEQTTWQSNYEDQLVWADDVSEATRQQVLQLQDQLKTATGEESEAIEARLAQLPTPQHSYQLCLQKGDRKITIDLWQLCYQICFRNYSPVLNAMDQELLVEIDTSLIDSEGEVDWLRLDQKAKGLIEQIFNSLSPPQPEIETESEAEPGAESESESGTEFEAEPGA